VSESRPVAAPRGARATVRSGEGGSESDGTGSDRRVRGAQRSGGPVSGPAGRGAGGVGTGGPCRPPFGSPQPCRHLRVRALNRGWRSRRLVRPGGPRRGLARSGTPRRPPSRSRRPLRRPHSPKRLHRGVGRRCLHPRAASSHQTRFRRDFVGSGEQSRRADISPMARCVPRNDWWIVGARDPQILQAIIRSEVPTPGSAKPARPAPGVRFRAPRASSHPGPAR
jgi:hypothetical protein